MNFTKKCSTLFSLTVITLLLPISALSQKVDTIELNGEQFFVYPFKVPTERHSAYYAAIKKERYGGHVSYDEYLNAYEEYFGPKMSKREFKRVMKRASFNTRKWTKSTRNAYSRKFVKAVRLNPYPLLEQDYDNETDVVPSLDPIPDGKYVQLFEGFCMLDEKGECTYVEDQVAGYFTIKNNVLDGYACWLNIKGDTLKSGNFSDGVKEGVWRFESRKLPYTLDDEDKNYYVEHGVLDADTMIIVQEYHRGAPNGFFKFYQDSEYPIEEGFFTDGNPSGKWQERTVSYDYVGLKRIRNRNNSIVTKSYTLSDDIDTTVVHQPWIRTSLIRSYQFDDEFDFVSIYTVPALPGNIYRINFEKEENLDLEEESYYSYGMDEYSEYDEMMESFEALEYQMSDEAYGSSYGKHIYDPVSDSYFSRGYLIDSLGAIANYKDTYIRNYPNGQLAYKYEFKNGALVKEDTVFWDNGIAYDVIEFNADSNYYIRTIYDYGGKKFKTLVYDSLGDYLKTEYEYVADNYVYLDGFKATYGDYSDYYSYDVYDTLRADLTEPLVLYRSWHIMDSSLLFNAHYDPDDRVLSRVNYSILGDSAIIGKRMFSEDFSSWTGKNLNRIGNLELHVTSSGALYEFDKKYDTIPQVHVQRAYSDYDVADDYVILLNGKEYTGPVSMNFGKNKFKANGKQLKFNFRDDGEYDNRLNKLITAYLEKGKVKDSYIMSYIDSKDDEVNIGQVVFSDFFKDILANQFYYPSNYHYSYNSYEEGRAKKSKEPTLSRIEGSMVEGKPHGIWTSYDQYNKVMKEVPYENGMVHGTVKRYGYIEGLEKGEEMWHYMNPIRDSLPEKRTYYLQSTKEYRNGLEDGVSRNYTWYSEIIRESVFKEGYLHGPAMERNRLAYSRMNYENGFLDGYVQTYLTMPERDSVLLFDLNFQEGNLQGESKSYHLNGNLSKRGFFLNGEPIEDYEAYDSLGFRYHYVKFKYSYPIEEKVWEENELSVRYQFDWQDSIIFEPVDITTSQSLERLLYKMGLGGYGMEMPYYGRPTLVNKKGVKFHMTKYYPNDTIARDGELDKGKKIGCWKYYSYDGELLYEVEYQDSVIALNDSIKFKSKGILTDFDNEGNQLYKAFIIEKFEKYDCSHTDHYEIRQLYTIWQAHDSLGRMNGYVKNYYDNGVLQNEGQMKDGLPDGIWKFYDPFGQLHQVGVYVSGKRDGRWLLGDLSKTKYLGDICLNPNMPDLEEEIRYRENLLDITITNYKLGKVINSQYYDVNMNQFIEENTEEEAVEEAVEEVIIEE